MKCINTVVLAFGWLLPLVSSKAKDVSPASFKVEFSIRRGSARDVLSPVGNSRPKFVKRDEDGSQEIELINEQTFYLANLYIGSNEDKNQVLVDTGSSDLWVMSHDLECYASSYGKRKRDAKNVFNVGSGLKFVEENEVNNRPTKSRNNKAIVKKAETSAYNSFTYLTDSPEASEYPEPSYNPYSYYSYESYYGGAATCTYYGTFNTENSDSFVRNDTDSFDISYADNTFASGIWGHDTVRIGNLSVKDLSFAVANESSSDVGVLGIGLPGLEVTNDASGYTYENLPLKMKSDGVINKALYSLYLDIIEAEAGTILFGAVDHAKYEGTLETLKLRNTYEEYDYPVKFDVPVDKIAVNKDGKTSTVLSSTEGVVLDSGSTLSYLRSEQIEKVADALDGVYRSDVMAYKVSCDYQDDKSITLDITFGSKTIKVPISDLILEAEYGSPCYLGLFPMSPSSTYILFGDNVLRSAYVVYDLEDKEVHIGQAYYTDDEDIEVVEQNVPTEGGQNPTSTDESTTETESVNGRSSTSETEGGRSTVSDTDAVTSSATRVRSVTSSESDLSLETSTESTTTSSSSSSTTATDGDSNGGLCLYSSSWSCTIASMLASLPFLI